MHGHSQRGMMMATEFEKSTLTVGVILTGQLLSQRTTAGSETTGGCGDRSHRRSSEPLARSSEIVSDYAMLTTGESLNPPRLLNER